MTTTESTQVSRMNIRPMNVRIRMWPASMFAKRRTQRERERHGDRARRGVDPPDRDPVVGLPGQRQRYEAEEVDDEDEEHQRRDVREPAADRLVRQALLGDLRLRDLVDDLAERLPAAGPLDAHQPDP